MIETLRTACNRDCPDACGLLATIEDGRVTRLQGDPDHPVTRGFLCQRTNRFVRDRQYAPDRVTTPLRRQADGSFASVSWDAALDECAEKMLRFRKESGPASIFHYRSGGSLGILKHVVDLLFERFGPVAIKSGDICSGAGEAAQETDFGSSESSDLFDLRHARAILLWGKNPYVSSVHLLPLLQAARERGARLALIDPVRHRTADLCELYLQPRPGGDFALAMGVAQVLFARGWVDVRAPQWCKDHAAFHALVHSHDLAAWASEADVRPAEIEALAELYGATPPANIQVGWGMQRRRNGAGIVRALDALGAITGNVGVPGGGVSFYFGRRNAFDTGLLRGVAAAPRTIPEPLLGPGLLAASDPPVRMVWVTAGNPVAMLPDSAAVARALESREFTVVVDSFLTDSARCADLVLPTTTMLEDDDLLGAYGHHLLASVRPVVLAPPGVKTDVEIARELARRLGLGADFERSAREWKEHFLSRVAPQGASLTAIEAGWVRNPEAEEVVYEGRRFATGDGRAHLLAEAPPAAARAEADYPLLLTSISTDRAQASQSTAAAQEGLVEATVHPAAANGLAPGAEARLVSHSGALRVRVRHDDTQRQDVVLVPKGGWHHKGRSANALTRAALTDLGEGAALYDEPVRLEPV
ncbi:MAG TPA: molybdopterin-dependent oxidoreductase [Planctomycetota bacterium]